jgi:hypothetical protein
MDKKSSPINPFWWLGYDTRWGSLKWLAPIIATYEIVDYIFEHGCNYNYLVSFVLNRFC